MPQSRTAAGRRWTPCTDRTWCGSVHTPCPVTYMQTTQWPASTSCSHHDGHLHTGRNIADADPDGTGPWWRWVRRTAIYSRHDHGVRSHAQRLQIADEDRNLGPTNPATEDPADEAGITSSRTTWNGRATYSAGVVITSLILIVLGALL